MRRQDVTVGSKLGPYTLTAAIGAGGMGEVWKARDSRLQRTVAIKFLRDEFGERFEREARAFTSRPMNIIAPKLAADELVLPNREIAPGMREEVASVRRILEIGQLEFEQAVLRAMAYGE